MTLSDPIPKPPKHLRAATARWWSAVVGEYVFEGHHVRLLTLAAEAFDRAAESREALATAGLVYQDRFDQPHPRPEVAIARDSAALFARLLRELGLDLVPHDSAELRPPRIRGVGGR